jgi:hypothetical protein
MAQLVGAEDDSAPFGEGWVRDTLDSFEIDDKRTYPVLSEQAWKGLRIDLESRLAWLPRRGEEARDHDCAAD